MKRPLSSLIPEPEDLRFKLIEVDIQNVQRGENQPRTKFDNDKLSQLSESISKNGILQPLIVQKINQNSFLNHLGQAKREEESRSMASWDDAHAIRLKEDHAPM